MKKLLAILLCLSLVFALAACSTPESQTQQPAEQPAQTEDQPTEPTQAEQPSEPEALTYPIEQFTVGTTAAIETAVFGEYNFDMLASGVSELPLVWQDAEGNYHPLLASYETADSVTWVYTIEPGMTWSDGEPVTAEDILFTLNYDDANGSANFVSQTDEDGKVTEAKYASYELSSDAMSISLTLSSANVRELSNMTSFRVMPKHIYEGKDSVTEAEARVTCGPYMLDSFNKEAGTLTFIPNPYYPQTPNVGKLTYRLFGNEDTMYLALQNGDLDMTWAYSTGVSGSYQDVLALMRVLIRKRKIGRWVRLLSRIFLISAGCILLWISCSQWNRVREGQVLLLAAMIVGILGVAAGVFVYSAHVAAWLSWRMQAKDKGRTCICLDDSVLTEESKKGTEIRPYSAFQEAYLYKKYWILFQNNYHAKILPQTAMTTGNPENFPAFWVEKTGMSIKTIR